MKKLICIPVEQYELMLSTYDKLADELREMKKALQEAATSKEPSNQ